MTSVTIDRARWNRGGTTLLLNGKGQYCILGWLLHWVYGYTSAELFYYPMPGTLKDPSRCPAWMVAEYDCLPGIKRSTALAFQLSSLNDRASLADCERERQLTELLATVDIAVTFTGGEAPDDYPTGTLTQIARRLHAEAGGEMAPA